MKTILLSASIFAAALLFCGCASVEVVKDQNLSGQKIANSGRTLAHIDAQNWGIYLFTIPLLTGSAEEPGAIRWNEDSVNVSAVTKMVTKKSAEKGGKRTIDLVSMTDSVNIPVPFPFILYWKTATVSGNSVK